MASGSEVRQGGGVADEPRSTLPPPPPLPGPRPVPPAGGKASRRGRPKFGLVAGAVVGLRLFREVAERVAFGYLGFAGFLVVGLAAGGAVIAWRTVQRRKVVARGGVEHTPEMVTKQLEDSGLLPPAYPEDGTIEGASILAVNQLPKILEVETQYEVFGSSGQQIGRVHQIGQSRGKRIARVLTSFDQFFTHHFELEDLDGRVLLRFTRPTKVFKSSLRIFDGQDRYLGTIRQENVFGKIRFAVFDDRNEPVAMLRAENLRAWDFHVEAGGREVATIVKSWEGWGRTAFTRADRYVLRLNEALPGDLRRLLVATPLMIDQGLKQDTRGLG